MQNLATILDSQGELVSAEGLLKNALSIELDLLGEEDIETAVTMNNLGVLLAHRNKFPEAKELLEKSVTLRTRVYGSGHHLTICAQQNLDYVLHRMEGLHGEAVAHGGGGEDKAHAKGEEEGGEDEKKEQLTHKTAARVGIGMGLEKEYFQDKPPPHSPHSPPPSSSSPSSYLHKYQEEYQQEYQQEHQQHEEDYVQAAEEMVKSYPHEEEQEDVYQHNSNTDENKKHDDDEKEEELHAIQHFHPHHSSHPSPHHVNNHTNHVEHHYHRPLSDDEDSE